jgi:hypothetical protein
MTRVLITAQMSLKPYLEAGRLNQQELLASRVSTGGKHTQEMLSGGDCVSRPRSARCVRRRPMAGG